MAIWTENDISCIFTAILDTHKNIPRTIFLQFLTGYLRMFVKIDNEICLKRASMIPILKWHLYDFLCLGAHECHFLFHRKTQSVIVWGKYFADKKCLLRIIMQINRRELGIFVFHCGYLKKNGSEGFIFLLLKRIFGRVASMVGFNAEADA